MKSSTLLNNICKCLILFSIFIFNSVWAAGAVCHLSITSDEFKDLVDRTRQHYFPELSGLNISIREFNSDAYYLQAKPNYKSLFKKKHFRKYYVEINTRLLSCPPSMESIEAILVHEFEHIKDYNTMSSVKIGEMGSKYALSKKFRSKYERQTDVKALEKGLGAGLIGYRNWIYAKLSPKQLLLKKRYYLTPEEIESWIEQH